MDLPRQQAIEGPFGHQNSGIAIGQGNFEHISSETMHLLIAYGYNGAAGSGKVIQQYILVCLGTYGVQAHHGKPAAQAKHHVGMVNGYTLLVYRVENDYRMAQTRGKLLQQCLVGAGVSGMRR